MKRFLLFTLLILFASVCFAGDLTAIEKDSFDVKQISHVDGFAKVEIDGITAFTSINFEKENIFIATDKLFYGSKDGQIDLTVYLGSLNPKNYKVAIELENGKRIDVKEYTINQSKTIPKSSLTDSFEIPSVPLTKAINSITLKVSFDPEEIGFLTKFNVVVYDLLGNEVFRLDPFLSGYGARQKLTYATSTLGLSGDVTTDLTIWLNIPNGNDFYSNHGCGDYNGMTFTQSDGETELNYDLISGDFANQDTNIILGQTETFPTASNLEGWFYYDGTCVDNADGTGAYPSNLMSYWHLDETSGNADDSTSNSYDLTHINTPTQGVIGKIGKAIDYDVASTEYSSNTTLLDSEYGDVSFSTWIKLDSDFDSSDGTNLFIASKTNGVSEQDTFLFRFSSNDGKVYLYVWHGGTIEVLKSTKTSWTGGTWYHLIATRNTTTGAMALYVNGSTTDGGTLAGNSGNVVAGTTTDFFIATHHDIVQTFNGVMDEFKVFNIALTQDDVNILYASETNNLITFGSEETPALDFNITFNVYQGNGRQSDLNNFNIDFNVNFYDQTGVNSPITIYDVNTGHYLVTISKDEWTDGNTFVLIVDANQTLTKTINKYVYPNIFQFERNAPFVSQSKNYQTISNFKYETKFTGTTAGNTVCSFWSSSNNTVSAEAIFRIQISENALNYITVAETTRTFLANTKAGSIYITTDDFNVSDGNHFFRIQQKIGQTGATYDLNTNGLVCNTLFFKDQNNFNIPHVLKDETHSTSSPTYETMANGIIEILGFNGFIRSFGAINYTQTIAKGTGYIKFLVSDFLQESAEYPRTTGVDEIGIGGYSNIFNDVNADGKHDVNILGKTTAGTTQFDFKLNVYQLNQKSYEFTHCDLNGYSTSSNSFEKILTEELINDSVDADFRVITVIPFSCSESNCLLEARIGVKNGFYDVNSLIMKRESDAISGDIGVAIVQYDFPNINVSDFNVSLYLKTDKGTINIVGGSMSVIRANLGTSSIPSHPQDPLVYAPINTSDVNGSNVDFNCWTTDPDDDPLTYDVNIIFRDTNATALVLETSGDGYGDFNSLALPNGIYSINCSVTDGNFTSFFENDNYYFTITNIPPIILIEQGVGYTRYFASYDDRKDLDDSNKFVNIKLVTKESTTLKNDEIAKNLLIGIIILLGILILLIIILMKGKK